jgi:nucleoside-diphosphate-sugar epimerase
MKPLNIAVIGCGYVGSKVALHWKNGGYHITSTTRHPARLPEISEVAQKVVLLKGPDREEFHNIISNNDVLVVTAGADRPDNYEVAYRQIAQMIATLALEMDAMPKRLIYTSSASVYGNHHGRYVDEESPLLNTSEHAKILKETEEIYLGLADLGWNVCIFRLSEIYGPERELKRRLEKADKSMFPGTGEQFSNMIHLDDCVGALDYSLRHHLEGLYNLSDDDHPTRKELYEKIAQKYQLELPQWDPTHQSIHSGNKRVSNRLIKSAGYSFKQPHRIF